MKQPIIMPVLSDTMEVGRLVRWLKKPGDPVKKGEVIAEVESDKAVMELEAFSDGWIAGPLAPEGSEIAVKQVIGWIADNPEEAKGEAAPTETAPEAAAEPAPPPEKPAPPPPEEQAPAAAPPPPKEAPKPPPAPAEAPPPPPPPQATAPSPGGTVSPVVTAALEPRRPASGGITPLARELAAELGLDPDTLPAGADGVVRAGQVLAAALTAPAPDLSHNPPHQVELPSALRWKVALNMQRTTDTPMFRVTTTADLRPLRDFAHEGEWSLTLLLARACALALTAHPLFNQAWTPKGLARFERIDIGIAMDIGEGLVTPVLRDMAGRPLEELAEDWRILKDKTQRRRLRPEDYEGATFYLSNLGTFPGVRQFDAIVPLGSSAILAVAAADAEGRTALTLSCDHRVVFGADAARFLDTLVTRLKQPETLVKP
ncbi:pyruvate dehydrogenase E2 component (dihydrolipoamide acetyltransferase) [Methylomarinovum tepidoasis]|uniref:Dihydrolipoamide acetyltransferase component of pyruvate dehydrogenase complex n=1 Tax=Methylomarinovum tepidoasis TaxID=2840183 RepID=A0AAU9C8T0_9GAMM|nr:2-oxo acid dehydrogenase subunit E2 [Methylomarinovum sp. IN45]BCX89689.1 pyruvate dehydrogenase E2 component (dihydrolipoamide acetyltransferase) [Methylomarinovum sp. IN45]